MTLCPAPSGLVCFHLVTQGVALGWYISPLQGLHQLCRFVGNFVAFVGINRKSSREDERNWNRECTKME
jgi:hypothetical protein